MPKFEIPIRVYYEDTDAEGVVYYANYLKYLERARSEWLREHNLSVASLAKHDSIIFVVRRVEIDYLQPACLDDQLSVSLEVDSASKASFTLKQWVTRDENVLIKSVVKMACLDATKFKPVKIPGKINQLIEKR